MMTLLRCCLLCHKNEKPHLLHPFKRAYLDMRTQKRNLNMSRVSRVTFPKTGSGCCKLVSSLLDGVGPKGLTVSFFCCKACGMNLTNLSVSHSSSFDWPQLNIETTFELRTSNHEPRTVKYKAFGIHRLHRLLQRKDSICFTTRS